MRVPQVTERMKEAPAHALRAVFAGIGQVLLVADRIKNRASDGDGAPPAAAPESPAAASATAAPGTTASPAAPAAASAAAPPAAPATTAPAASTATSTAPAPTAPATASAKAPAAKPASRAATAKAPAASPAVPSGPAAGDLPLPGYDELSIPSLRARMRSLDPAQLRALADYESAHESRAAVLAMFERRITKVESGEA